MTSPPSEDVSGGGFKKKEEGVGELVGWVGV